MSQPPQRHPRIAPHPLGDPAVTDLTRALFAQLVAPETPDVVGELPAEEGWALATALANVVRNKGWAPPADS